MKIVGSKVQKKMPLLNMNFVAYSFLPLLVYPLSLCQSFKCWVILNSRRKGVLKNAQDQNPQCITYRPRNCQM